MSAEFLGRVRRRLLIVLLLAAAGRFVAFDVAMFLAPHASWVDFSVYYNAASAVAHGGHLYANPPPCCYSNEAMQFRYTYPPLFAMLLVPLTSFSVDDAGRIMLIVSNLALLAILLVGSRAGQRVSWELVGWVALLLASGPVFAALYGMQATPLVVALEAIFAMSVVRDRWLVAGGACLAIAVCFKVTPLLLVPVLLMLPRRSALRALVGIGSGLAVAFTMMLLASQETVFYLSRVLPSFSGGVIAPWNRSLPGVVLRAADAASAHAGPALGTIFLGVELAALVATFSIFRRIPGPTGRRLMLAGLLSVIPIVQGVTWDQHLVVEVLVLILLAPLLRFRSLPWVLTIVGVALITVPQFTTVDVWLTNARLEPPRGIIAFVLFVTASTINLLGMIAIWLAAVVTARRLRSAVPSSARPASMRPQLAGT